MTVKTKKLKKDRTDNATTYLEQEEINEIAEHILTEKEKAREILIAECKKDEEKCSKGIEAVLKECNCRLDIGMMIFAGRNEPIMRVVSNGI